MIRCIKLHDQDNVAVAVCDIQKGEEVCPGVTALTAIPQGHKIALRGIPQNEGIIRYGVTLGYANADIPAGGVVHEEVLRLPTPPALDEMHPEAMPAANITTAPITSFDGYETVGCDYAGTRNILAIHTTVQCVTGVLNVAIERIKHQLLPRFENVDDVVAINHAYGCGVAINAPDAAIPIRTLQNLVHHPNFGGEVMVVSLGCEKLTVENLLDLEDNTPENVIVLQEISGFEAMINAIMTMAERKLKQLNLRRRVTLPLSKLIIGMQCGGSDAFSGITANPAAGYASDMLIASGATVLFSEVTEVRDGVHLLGARCIDRSVCGKLADEMRWYDAYLERGQTDRSANPSPGNKKGGLSNIVEKAMGSIAKSGISPIVQVLSPGEKPTRHGLIYAATPASDIVCGPCQLASGITLQVFMTGRGTPYGLAAAPVIKVCSRSEMKERWYDLIDIDAGPIATGLKTVEQIGMELFYDIIDVASGKKKPFAEKYHLQNDLCLFNPAPIT